MAQSFQPRPDIPGDAKFDITMLAAVFAKQRINIISWGIGESDMNYGHENTSLIKTMRQPGGNVNKQIMLLLGL